MNFIGVKPKKIVFFPDALFEKKYILTEEVFVEEVYRRTLGKALCKIQSI